MLPYVVERASLGEVRQIREARCGKLAFFGGKDATMNIVNARLGKGTKYSEQERRLSQLPASASTMKSRSTNFAPTCHPPLCGQNITLKKHRTADHTHPTFVSSFLPDHPHSHPPPTYPSLPSLLSIFIPLLLPPCGQDWLVYTRFCILPEESCTSLKCISEKISILINTFILPFTARSKRAKWVRVQFRNLDK